MGKHSRVKASAKDKRRQLHPEAPAAVAVHPEMEEEAPVSRSLETAPDAAPQKTAAGEGRKVPTLKPASNGGHPSSALAEEVQHLRTLNGILAKQMVEARQERDKDQVLLSKIERAVIGAALASQLSEEGGRLTRMAGEKGRADGADVARREAARVMEERHAETESRWMGVLAEIERKKAAARDENARLMRDLRELAEEKTEVEKKLRTAEAEADAIRGSLQDARKAFEGAQEENLRCKNDLQSVVLERDEARKQGCLQTEERKALEIKISNLEKRHEEAKRALDLSLSRCRALEEESDAKEATVASLTKEKVSLEKSLSASIQMVEELRRKMDDAVLAKDEEAKKVLLERDEARQGLRLQMQEMKDLVARAREAAEEVLRRALSECQPLEETAAEWRRDLESLKDEAASEESVLGDALRFLNKLSGEMAKEVQVKGEELERTKAEMDKVISVKGAECAVLSKLNSSFSSQLATLKDEHESLKAERDDLRSQVAELSASNGDAQKVLERLHVELKKQAEEEEEKNRSHQSLVEGYLQQIEHLTREMEAAAEGREVLEKEKAEQKDKLLGLEEVVANLNSELAAQKELSGNHARESEALRAEKNGVQECLGQQTQKVEELVQELKELEKSKNAMDQKLGELQSVNAQLLEEKQKMERRVNTLGEEKTSAERSLAVAEGRLENAEKMVGALQKVTNEALTMMKNAAAEAARRVGGEGKKAADEEEVVEVGSRPFAAEVEAIRRALRRREEEMEEMRREMARQLESVEGVQRANVSWKWVSSAMAAVSTTALAWAFAARGR